VDEAASYLEKNGEKKAFEEFRKEGKWRKGNTYLFVYDMQGVTKLLPPQANLEGTNRLNARDTKGKYFVKEMIEYLKTHTSGWLGYYYIKPGNDTQYLKLSYFKKVRVSGKEMLIGSGVYLE
jgi:methyl-accepting chemotaxis protein